jgi:hypothetical protein
MDHSQSSSPMYLSYADVERSSNTQSKVLNLLTRRSPASRNRHPSVPSDGSDDAQVSVRAGPENTNNALDVLQEKIFKLQGANDELIRQNSTLTQEICGLKTNLTIESEDMLISLFDELHYYIRSWCQKFSEIDKRQPDPELPKLPVTSNTYDKVEKPDGFRVVYSIACLWELLVDRVFQPPLRVDKPKDLWTTSSNAEAINRLEKALASAGN